MTDDLEALAPVSANVPNAAKTQRQYHITRRADGTGLGLPYLAMSGNWLERAGFPLGTRVMVAVEQGRLVVTAAGPAKEPVAPPRDGSYSPGRSDAARPARNRR